ncbi:hypothetical protein CVT26_002189 [Gymnopilus dilepis]|uniref:FAM86 N-terminal domain-containing protein n=1 Tax=Gymnopilus dilepis TaxID=231916 RepID=A0A409VBG1_9AGAR|nr:hypothetical protein CVT26_002189 [Gymnopilus dilepis]
MDPQLFALLRQFYALTPPRSLQFPRSCPYQTINEFLVNDILQSPHFQRYPPSSQYQNRFWKWVIQSLEDASSRANEEEAYFEIDSQIYDHYLALDSSSDRATNMSLPGPSLLLPSSPSYITHFWNPQDEQISPRTMVDLSHYQTTTLLESRNLIESGTTGLRTWLASFVLSQYLILHPELIASKRILELGSGIGFLGIIVCTLQQLQKTRESLPIGSLWLTDVNDEVLARCRDNIRLPCNLSSLHPDVSYLKLDWSESLDPRQPNILATLVHEKVKPELILGADIVFDPSLIPALIGTLRIALQSIGPGDRSKVALIALTLRNESTMQQFISHVRDSSFSIQEIDVGFRTTSFSETVEANNYPENVKLFRITAVT